MTRFDVPHFEPWKEPSNNWNSFIADIFAFRTAYEQRGLLESDFVRVFEGKVGHVVQRGAKYSQGDPKSEAALRVRSREIGQEELPYW